MMQPRVENVDMDDGDEEQAKPKKAPPRRRKQERQSDVEIVEPDSTHTARRVNSKTCRDTLQKSGAMKAGMRLRTSHCTTGPRTMVTSGLEPPPQNELQQ